jgi:uncharacterized protein YaiI (UPF0178 family)
VRRHGHAAEARADRADFRQPDHGLTMEGLPARAALLLSVFGRAMPKPIEIYVDADACPVKSEVYRVAERHGLKVFVVSNSPIAVPRHPLIERVVVGAGTDEADNWIAERATRGDVVITADVPLASRSIKAGAAAIAPTGKAFDEDSIGLALATRNLLHDLRSAGEVTGGPKPFAPGDRSKFLSTLDLAIVRWKRQGFGD